ncbi:MAG: DUF1579 family protein [Planctomycetota bacterium]
MNTNASRSIAAALLPILALSPLLPDARPARQDPVPVVAGADEPTAEHRLLQRFAGRWLQESGSAAATVRSIGAYHVEFEFTGSVMGAPYAARLLLGHCPLERRLFAVQVDNLSASPMRLAGTCDPATGRITLRGTCAAASGALGACVLRLTIADDGTFAYGLAAVADDGQEHALASLSFRRANDAQPTTTQPAGAGR